MCKELESALKINLFYIITQQALYTETALKWCAKQYLQHGPNKEIDNLWGIVCVLFSFLLSSHSVRGCGIGNRHVSSVDKTYNDLGSAVRVYSSMTIYDILIIWQLQKQLVTYFNFRTLRINHHALLDMISCLTLMCLVKLDP